MDAYIGDIRMFAGNFAPSGWTICDGRQLSIAEYEALFILIGTTYGGDGITTFAVPDLRGRVPLHQGQGPDGVVRVIGQQGGLESVTLSQAHLPSHTHRVSASTAQPPQSTSPIPITGMSATMVPASPSPKPRLYGAPGAMVNMAGNAVLPTGGGQPHENMGPYLAINFIIALFGVFPNQS